MTDIYDCRFFDPYKKQLLSFRLISLDKLEVSPYARRSSEYHVHRLITSINKLGFLVPLMVVEDSKKENRCIIIDGQHRFMAARILKIPQLPVFILPQNLAEQLMHFNIEKELNIRERSFVALAIYRRHLSETPNMLETAPEIVDSIENAYYITLGLGYEKKEDLTGAAFEPVLRKSDFFLNNPLKETYSIRDRRASQVIQVNSLVREIVQKFRQMGEWNPYIYNQIITWANPYKRKRVTAKFEELFPVLTANLEYAKQNPKEVREEILQQGEEGVIGRLAM